MKERAELIKSANLMREVFIPYDLADEIQRDIEIIDQRDNCGSKGGIMTLLGASGSGKTKVLSDYKSRYPTVEKGIHHENGEFAERMES